MHICVQYTYMHRRMDILISARKIDVLLDASALLHALRIIEDLCYNIVPDNINKASTLSMSLCVLSILGSSHLKLNTRAYSLLR